MQRGIAVRVCEVRIRSIVEQHVYGLCLSHRAGDHQGRQSRLRLRVIRFRAGAEQNAGAGLVALLGGEHQRREAGFRTGVNVGAAFDQFLDNRGLTLRDRPHQGGLSAVGFPRVGVGVARQQRAHVCEVAPARRFHERRLARHQGRVGIGASCQQLFDHRRIGVRRCCIERRCAEFVGRLRVRAGAQEKIGHHQVIARGRPDQRGRPFGPGDRVLRTPVHQRLHGCAVPLLGGSHQRQIVRARGKRRARAQRRPEECRENRCFRLHRRSPTFRQTADPTCPCCRPASPRTGPWPCPAW